MTRRTMWIGLLVSLPAVATFAGCAAEPAQPALNDTEWVLVQWGTPGDLRPALDGRDATLWFSGDNHATGNAGCNGWGGSCNIGQEGTISFTDIIHTEMYCIEPGVMEQEQFFLDALLASQHYAVTGGMLRISGEELVLVLRPLEP